MRTGIVPESEGRGFYNRPFCFIGDMTNEYSEPRFGRTGKCQYCHSDNYPKCVGHCRDYPVKDGKPILKDPEDDDGDS